MKAQISGLLRAVERSVQVRHARAAPRHERARAVKAQICRDFSSWRLTCSSGFGIFRPPLLRGGQKSGSLEFRFVQRRITMAKKKAKKAGKKRKPNAAFMKAMTPSASLAAVIGSSAMPRTEVTKKIWGYIKRNGLQDKKNRRMINADDKLKAVFGGKGQVSMFEMTKLVNKHLK
jgi:chromatin remodeling complex protein RSC6